MIALRAAFAVAILVGAGCKDRDPAGAPAAAPGVSQGSGRAAVFAPAGPSLDDGTGSGSADVPAVPAAPAQGQGQVAAAVPPPAAGPPRDVFATQARDPVWAAKAETEISARLGKLKVAVDRVECRTNRCELALGGDSDAVAAAIGKLESTRGLAGYAQSVLLTKPEQQGDRLVLRAYATFNRSTTPAPTPGD